MDLGAAAGVLRDPPWSVAVAPPVQAGLPGALSGTFPDHRFPWGFIQKEPSCKRQNSARQTRVPQVKEASEVLLIQKINASTGAASGYFAETIT